MAIRKTTEETLVVDGDGKLWLDKCRKALEQSRFRNIESDGTLDQVRGDYRKLKVWGSLEITLTPRNQSPPPTQLVLRTTANVDNVYALFRSPGGKILAEFKNALKQQ